MHHYLTISFTTGIAIFCMFFGSGNVVFPLVLGQKIGSEFLWGLFGLSLTAVGAPLLGLLGAVLFKGDCKAFFYRIGVVPGYLVVLLVMALLGPLGLMPRCFVVTYGAIQGYFPDLSLFSFSLIAGVVTFLLILKRELILPLLGMFFSPILIIILLVIVGVSIVMMPPMQDVGVAPFDAFKMGIIYGYDTLDLLAGIFYAVSTWLLLNEQLKKHAEHMQKQLLFIFILSSLVAGACLTLIYAGLTFGAAAHLDALANAQPQRILAVLAEHLLGPKLGLVANIGIAIACMTTAMSLAVSIVDVIHMEIQDTWFARRFKWHYEWVLIGVILITVAFANLGFQKIMSFLHPIMEVCYPAIIMLTICNILYKMYGFEHVKVPVYLTAGLALVWQIYTLAF